MASLSTWCRYIAHKIEYSLSLSYKDPEKSDDFLVRRLAAIEGMKWCLLRKKMTHLFLTRINVGLHLNNLWLEQKLVDLVLLHYFSLFVCLFFHWYHRKPMTVEHLVQLSMSNIVGRVIYCLQTAVDHGPVQNSHFSMRKDSPVLEVELDVDEMAKNHKA
ncbi:hypothetical protein NC652_004892 [Populus alba x Populus x berolinensis]|nr:hypothetical protein NC652_004892 [Populus alba x Populus x berolinensis]